jgi:hypothetical protein
MRVKNKFFLVFMACIFSLCELRAQELNSQQLDFISRNILSYHFREALNHEINLKSDRILADTRYFFDELWPKENQDLKLDVFVNSLVYPVNEFKLYTINKKGFQIGNDSIRIYRTLSSFQADEIYLVAYNPSNGKLKFISGNFFQSSIESDFNLDIGKPSTFNEYLILRTYNWGAKDIEFYCKKKKKLIFKAYSQYLKDKIFIEVDRANLDQVNVKPIKISVIY